MNSKPIAIVVAYTYLSRAIGKEGNLPWNTSLKEDLAYFKKLTTQTIDPSKINAIIMGRKTWDSIPEKHRPLDKRLNIVISNTLKDQKIIIKNNLMEAIDDCIKNQQIERIFIIGGGQIYNTIMDLKLVDEIYATVIYSEYDNCDTFFPNISVNDYEVIDIKTVDCLKFIKYIRIKNIQE